MDGTDRPIPWHYRPLGITLLTLLVLGPLGLPLVWRSPALDARGKWLGTALVLAYTAVLVWQVVVAVRYAVARLP